MSSSAGFTLIELMITLAVVAMGVVGISRVFLGTLDASASANARTRASAIATREVERVQAIAYDHVGLPTGSPATFESRSTVIVATSPIGHTGSETIDGITFSITRWVVWEAGTSAYSDAIKRVTAIVAWQESGAAYDVRADAAVYPGGRGPRATVSSSSTTSTTLSTPGTPTGLTATLSAASPHSQIELAWSPGSPAPSTWEIQRSHNGGVNWTTLTTTQPAGTRTYSSGGLSASTTYTYRVRGLGGQAGAWSATVSATTQSAPATCSVQSATASPSTQIKKNNGTLDGDVSLTVNTAGSCSNLQAEFASSPGNNKIVTFGQSGSTFTHTIGKNTYADWSTGSKTIYVKRSGTTVAQISLVISN